MKHPGPVLSRIVGIALAAASVAQSGAAAHAAVAVEEVLDNGLRVILVPHRANPMIASSVVVGAGVVYEPEGMNGASHFLEHLLFNGTERRTQRQLYDEVDRYGAYNNATTREDHTLFSLLIQKEYVEAGLDIQADMLFHSTLPADKFEKEKGIVLEEMARDKGDPAYVAEGAFRSFAYAGTPLARPILGDEASIRALNRDDVHAYYQARYVPSNMTLVLMGDFEPAAMRLAVAKTFGVAKKAKSPKAPEASWPPVPEKNLSVIDLDAGRVYIHAAFPVPWAPQDRRFAALELMLSALSDGKDSPLGRSLTSGPEPLALAFSLGASPRTVPWSTVEFSATLPEGKDPSAVLDLLVQALRATGRGSPARDRLEGVRSAARSDEILTADQIHYYAMMRSAYVPGASRGYFGDRVALLDSLADRDWDDASRLLQEGVSGLRVAIAGPQRQTALTAWRAGANPPQEAAEKVRRIVTALPNGLETVIERNDDSEVFALHLFLRPRSDSEPPGKDGIADMLHRLFLRGTLWSDRGALSARVETLGARLKLHDDPSIPYDDDYTTPDFSFVRLEIPGPYWREGLALLAEMVRAPRLDKEDVEAVRKEMLDLTRRRTESTRAQAADLLNRTLAPDHPLSRPVSGTPESLAAITPDDLRTFHAAYVTGRRAVVTVVAPVSPDQVLRGIEGAFGTLPPGEPPRAVPPPPVTPPGLHKEATVGKEQASISLASVFDADPADRPSLMVAGALLSDHLAFKLREEQGLAYSIGAGFRPYGGRVRFEVTMGTRQANVERALEGLKQGLAEFAASELEPAKLERAANAIRGRQLMRRLTRINQAYFAGLEKLEGRPPGDDLRLIEAIRQVRPEDVVRVLRRYVAPERMAVIEVR